MNELKLNQQQQQNQVNAIECGNCWGHQEWHGIVSEQSKKRTDKTLDGFILKFIKKYL